MDETFEAKEKEDVRKVEEADPNGVRADDAVKEEQPVPSAAHSPEQQLILTGSLWKAVLSLAWPIFFSMVALSFAGLADTFVAGHLDAAAQAAVGMGDLLWFLVLLLSSAVATGAEALISRHWGAGEKEEAQQVAKNAMFLAVVIGVISAVVGLIFLRSLFRYMGASEAVEDKGWQYLRFNMFCVIPFSMMWTANAIFRALGRTRVYMVAMSTVAILVAVCDYVLCIRFNLGISGIGISWAIAGFVGAAIFWYHLKNSEFSSALNLRDTVRSGLNMTVLWRVARIGVPGSLQDVISILAGFAILVILSHTNNPTDAQAAWSIGLKTVDLFALVSLSALSHAIGPIVGQNMGAGNVQRAEDAARRVSKAAMIMGCVVGGLLVIFSKPITAAMTQDASVAAMARDFLIMLGLAQPFNAAAVIWAGAMNGAGYSRWPAIISTAGIIVVELPLAYLLTAVFNLGVDGTWFAMFAMSLVVWWSMRRLFELGSWKSHNL